MGERCGWCGTDPLYVAYHDDEWGVPEHDSRALYEKLVLDGFQAGLSWFTILRKRENSGRPSPASNPTSSPPGVSRTSSASSATQASCGTAARSRRRSPTRRAWQRVEADGGFSNFIWSAVDHRARQNDLTVLGQIPATSPQGDALAKRLKKAGFKFCGPTIVYAFAQAVGLVNDHLVDCPAYARCAALA